MTDLNEDIKALQTRILGLEETISAYKKRDEERERAGKRGDSDNRIADLQRQLEASTKELTELRQKFWDGKERRTPSKDRRNWNQPKGESIAGGPWL